ncbi:hypothetical protein KIL84_008864 [Mauremys mutica]|uniref:Uncharacterized protein n=1 Tax=Mauremys mutica TaxID=74926 RepID=A0A9D3X8E7_9SAUR|nr:hypothetical protein KIL84_008864 [Mauremys mutica]
MMKVDVLGCPTGGSTPDRVVCLGGACRPLPGPSARSRDGALHWVPGAVWRSLGWNQEHPGGGEEAGSHTSFATREGSGSCGRCLQGFSDGQGKTSSLEAGNNDLTGSTQTHPPVRPLHKCRDSSEGGDTTRLCAED